MAFASLQANQISSEALNWYTDFLRAASVSDWRQQLPFFAEDAMLQTNNRVPAHGHAAIAAELARYWQGFNAIRHEPLNILGYDDHFAIEMLCHYALHGGAVFTIPACGFLSRNGEGRIQTMRLFADVSPIFS